MDVFGSVKCPPVSALLHKRVLLLTVWVCNYFYYTITLIPTAEVDWVTKPVCRDVVVFYIKDYGLKFIYLQSSACSHTYAVLSYLPITLSSEERRFFFIWNGNISSCSLKTTWVCANYANTLMANPAGPGIAQTPTKKWNMGQWQSGDLLYVLSWLHSSFLVQSKDMRVRVTGNSTPRV